MTAAATVVRPGGLIICAAECRDGFPDHGSFREVLASEDSPEALLRRHLRAAPRPCPTSGRCRSWPGSWRRRASACTRRTSPTRTCAARTCSSWRTSPRAVADELAAVGPDARVCVLPEGPQTIPYVVDAGRRLSPGPGPGPGPGSGWRWFDVTR